MIQNISAQNGLKKIYFLRIFTNIFEAVTNLPPFLILPPAWPCKFFYLRVSLILGTSNMSHKKNTKLEIFLIVSVQKCIDLRSGNQQNVKTLVCTLYKPSVHCKRDLAFQPCLAPALDPFDSAKSSLFDPDGLMCGLTRAV